MESGLIAGNGKISFLSRRLRAEIARSLSVVAIREETDKRIETVAENHLVGIGCSAK